MHIKYPKIHRLWKDETDWILDEWYVYIEEKIDWANLSIWMSNWKLCVGSRNNVVCKEEETINWFNWAVEYILSHNGIREYLKKHPTHRLYWEWLVKHTINYPEHHYRKFWLFDVLLMWDEETPIWMDLKRVKEEAEKYSIETPDIFFEWDVKDLSQEVLEWFVGNSNIWAEWEWVVIKNYSFKNRYGRPSHAKLVSKSFQEQNMETFGNHHRWDLEWYITATYITFPRMGKLVNKVEQNEWRDILIQDTPRIMGMMYYDLITEDLWEILRKKKKAVIDFGRLARMVNKKTRNMFHEWLRWEEMSVAFKTNDNNE